MRWQHRVKVKHLFTRENDYVAVRKSMSAVADELKLHGCFNRFDKSKFYNIPEGDDIVPPVDYANRLIDRMYDYADDNGIWVE